MEEEGKSKFRFLTNDEFSLLDQDAKARYLIEATKALTAMTAELTRATRRDDEAA